MESFSNLAMAGAFMAGLGVVLALLLAFANKKLYVYEDPRIGEVEELLPKSNCGACGQAGCRDFAEKVVGGSIIPAPIETPRPLLKPVTGAEAHTSDASASTLPTCVVAPKDTDAMQTIKRTEITNSDVFFITFLLYSL